MSQQICQNLRKQRYCFLCLCAAPLIVLSAYTIYTPAVTILNKFGSETHELSEGQGKSSANRNDARDTLRSASPQNISAILDPTTSMDSTTTTSSAATTCSTPTAESSTTTITTLTTKAPPLYLTTFFIGRLGNQMFSYATLVGLARAQHRVPFVSTGADLQKTFQITNVRIDINHSEWSSYGESKYAVFDDKLIRLPQKNVSLFGYLQSWRYFHHSQDEIRREYTLLPSIQKEVDAVLADHRSQFENHVLVGVHVRRGDFLWPDKQRYGYGVPEASYFVKAFEKMRSLIPNQNITFLLATDDKEWCTNNVKDSNVRFLPGAEAGIHFALLSSCDHVILTGGTFGWWIAWLANGITIYYKDFIRKNSHLEKGFSERDYYPPGWIGLEN